MKVFQHLAQGVIAERPIFCNNSSRNEVNIDDAAIVERSVSVLMGDKVQPRREWIENNVQFSLEDSFFMEG